MDHPLNLPLVFGNFQIFVRILTKCRAPFPLKNSSVRAPIIRIRGGIRRSSLKQTCSPGIGLQYCPPEPGLILPRKGSLGPKTFEHLVTLYFLCINMIFANFRVLFLPLFMHKSTFFYTHDL